MDPVDPNEPKWYAVVRVVGHLDGDGLAQVVSTHPTWLDAAQAAAKRGMEFQPFPESFAKEPPSGFDVRFRLGQYPALDGFVNEIKWQEENAKPVLVCRWDGRYGPPEPNLRVALTGDRDYRGATGEFVAQPFGPRERPCEEPWFVVVERAENNRRTGWLIGMGTQEEATKLAVERIAFLQQLGAALRPDALSHVSVGEQARRIAQEFKRQVEVAEQPAQTQEHKPTHSL